MRKNCAALLVTLFALAISGCTASPKKKSKKKSSISESSEVVSSSQQGGTSSSSSQGQTSNSQGSSAGASSSSAAPISSAIPPISTASTVSSSQQSPSSSQSGGSGSQTVPPGPGDYYSGISDSLSGTNLRNALNSLNTAKKIRNFKYADHKEYQQLIELDPKGTIPAGKMVGFYDNAIVNGPWDNQATWNREHVWPNSRGGGSVEGDLHMVRPTSVSINSERGNDVYGTINGTYDPGQYCAEYRGIAARIIFYCAIANKSLVLNEDIENNDNNMGILSELLKWNLQYLPGGQDSSSLALRVEWYRNETIEKHEKLQGNRNPFVDHPEYACKIWGSYDSATKAVCGL